MPAVPGVQGPGGGRGLQPLVPGPIAQGGGIASSSSAGGGAITAGAQAGASIKRQGEAQDKEHQNRLERDEERTKQQEQVTKYSDTLVSAREEKERVWQGRVNQWEQAAGLMGPMMLQGLATPDMVAKFNDLQRRLLLDPIRMEHIVDTDTMSAAIELANSEGGLQGMADIEQLTKGYNKPVNDEMAKSSVNNLLTAIADSTRNTAGQAILHKRLDGYMRNMETELTDYTNKRMTAVFNLMGYNGSIDFENPMNMYTDVNQGWKLPAKMGEHWAATRKKELEKMGRDARDVSLTQMWDAFTPQGSPLSKFMSEFLEQGGNLQVETSESHGLGAGGMGPPAPSYGAQRTSADEIIHRLPPEVAYAGAMALPAYAEIAADLAMTAEGKAKTELMAFSKVLTDVGGVLATSHRGIGVPPRKAALLEMINDLTNRAYAIGSEGGDEDIGDLKAAERELTEGMQDFRSMVDEPVNWSSIIAERESQGPFSAAARLRHPVWGSGTEPVGGRARAALLAEKGRKAQTPSLLGAIGESTLNLTGLGQYEGYEPLGVQMQRLMEEEEAKGGGS